jgi:hypothetical protein
VRKSRTQHLLGIPANARDLPCTLQISWVLGTPKHYFADRGQNQHHIPE